MIVGNDISNFQGNVDFATYSKNSNFLIAKATEGTGYIDTWYANNRTQSRNHNLPFGSYHFARPDTGNSAQDEADFFCKVIDGDPIREGEILALDYEVNYHDPVGWCRTWLDVVYKHFGFKPLIYLNQATAKGFDWSPVINAGYGLWIAAYTYDPTDNNFETGKWDFAALQQWTDKQNVPGISGNIDGDVFFGDAKAFGKYGYQKPVVVSTPPPIETPVETPPVSVPPIISTDPVVTIPLPPVETSTPPVETSTTPPVVPPINTPPITPSDQSILKQILDVLNKIWGSLKKFLG